MPNLRPCLYKGEKHFFHMWFQEGGQLDDGGSIDVGAILETESGNVIKVWDIKEIRFLKEAEVIV